MEKIVLASNNKGKIKEFKQIFQNKEILTLEDIGFFDEIEETGTTFLENSLIKAKTVSEYLKSKGKEYDVIADDSGLCINSLNGEPGVYSARYAGEHGDSVANRKKVLDNLIGKEDRTAYFACSIVLYHPNGNYITAEGKTYGSITTQEIGSKEFGYDCLFLSDDLGKTFGEATSQEKNSVSHRARAISNLFLKRKNGDVVKITAKKSTSPNFRKMENKMLYEFEVPGKITGKGRPRVNSYTGIVYTPTNTKDYESLVQQYFVLKYPKFKPLETRVEIKIVAYFGIPKSTSKCKAEEMLQDTISPTKKPDIDNIVKIILDALNKVAFIDDTQITKLSIEKKYENEEKVCVQFMPY